MLALIVLIGLYGRVESEKIGLVYNQTIYSYLFETERVEEGFGVYNRNSPPMRKDEMTYYDDGMVQFNHSIDAFVDHHCDPYTNFLESKCQAFIEKLCGQSFYSVKFFGQIELWLITVFVDNTEFHYLKKGFRVKHQTIEIFIIKHVYPIVLISPIDSSDEITVRLEVSA